MITSRLRSIAMNKQAASDILMIQETASNNIYQQKPGNIDINQIQQQALAEFDALVQKLSDAGVNVIVLSDTPKPHKPDALFPNNWISFHKDGIAVLYPMYAASRRTERRKDILDVLEKQHGFTTDKLIDLTHYEVEGKFLEGTGSLVLDRENKIAYASISERTSPELVEEFCRQLNYKPVLFHAVANALPVYHTNVLLTVCSKFVVICLDYISSDGERENLLEVFKSTNKVVLTITQKQASAFAGNMLELKSKNDDFLLVMSTCAYNSLNEEQVAFLQQQCKIIHSPLDTIEKFGGGSARCMIAEIFSRG
jgi:hypothetical protein